MKTIEKGIIEHMKNTHGEFSHKDQSFRAGVEYAQRWIPIEKELPTPSNDESGFGDILSEYVIVKDKSNNYDVKRYDHLAMRWTGSRNVVPKFWRPINIK